MNSQLLMAYTALWVLQVAPCAEQVAEPAKPIGGDRIIVEVTAGHGGDRQLYVLDALAADAVPQPASKELAQEFDAYVQSCKLLSECAFDDLRAATSGSLPQHDVARKLLRVTPGLHGPYATIIDAHPYVGQIVKLKSGTEVELPTEPNRRMMEPLVWGRDGNHLAVTEAMPGSLTQAARVLVLDVPRGMVSSAVELGPGVQDIAWNSECTKLAVLVSDQQSGDSAEEEGGKLLGHGVPHVTFRLIVVDLVTQSRIEWKIAQDVRYGSGNVLWDEQAVTCLADEATAGRMNRAER